MFMFKFLTISGSYKYFNEYVTGDTYKKYDLMIPDELKRHLCQLFLFL